MSGPEGELMESCRSEREDVGLVRELECGRNFWRVMCSRGPGVDMK